MYIRGNYNKKIEFIEIDNFKDKVKSFKFCFDKIDYGIRIKSKFLNTYLFCQKVDICITDKDNKIIKLYENIRSEKLKFILKAKYIYYLPLESCKFLKVDEVLNIKEK